MEKKLGRYVKRNLRLFGIAMWIKSPCFVYVCKSGRVIAHELKYMVAYFCPLHVNMQHNYVNMRLIYVSIYQ